MSITLDPQMGAFVDEQVSGGQYGSAAEVVDAALRLLRGQAEIEAIRAAIEEGEQSGEPQPFDSDEFLAELHRKHAR
jgi:antitoxin ParD1/3/4